MTLLLSFLFFTIFAANVAFASTVKHVTSSDFDETVKNSKDDLGWMVKFYAPWCGHCKKLAPTWDQLAAAADGQFGVASVDCTSNQALCGDFKIKGYPTLKYFKNKKIYSYQGARSLEALSEFAKGKYTSAESTEY